MGGEKTEAPTPKRLQDSVKKGDVWQSRELGNALAMGAMALWIVAAGGMLVEACGRVMAAGLTFDRDAVESATMGQVVLEQAGALVVPFALLLGATLLAAVAGPLLLGALVPRWSALGPKAQRLSPAAGLKRMFGAQGLIELVKAIIKVGMLGGLAIWVIAGALPQIAAMGAADPAAALSALGPLIVHLLLVLAGGLAVIALVDVPVQYVRRIARLRMSKQEVRNEHKEAEGSPELKSAIRARQHAVLSRSARKAVADASVVLVNPTHFAVALRYRPGVDGVPVVVASGKDGMAAAIRMLAEAKGVPVLRHAMLARAVFFTSKVGQGVDNRLYLAVATILAFLFRLEAQLQDDGAAQLAGVAVPGDLQFDSDGNPLSPP